MDDDVLAVVAHSLLGPVIGCQLGAKLLLEQGPAVTDDLRDETLRLIIERATFTSELLHDLMRGGSALLLDVLDQLGDDRSRS